MSTPSQSLTSPPFSPSLPSDLSSKLILQARTIESLLELVSKKDREMEGWREREEKYNRLEMKYKDGNSNIIDNDNNNKIDNNVNNNNIIDEKYNELNKKNHLLLQSIYIQAETIEDQYNIILNLESLNDEYLMYKESNTQSQSIIEEKIKYIDELTLTITNIKENHSKEVAELNKNTRRASFSNDNSNSMISNLNNEISIKNLEIESLKKAIHSFQSMHTNELSIRTLEKSNYEETIIRLTNEYKELDVLYKGLLEKNKNYEIDKSEYDKTIKDLEFNLRESDKKLHELQLIIDSHFKSDKSIEEYKKKIDMYDQELNSIKLEYDNLNVENNKLQSSISNTSKQFEKLTKSTAEELKLKDKQMEEQYSEARSKVLELQNQIISLRDENSQLKELSKFQNRVTDIENNFSLLTATHAKEVEELETKIKNYRINEEKLLVQISGLKGEFENTYTRYSESFKIQYEDLRIAKESVDYKLLASIQENKDIKAKYISTLEEVKLLHAQFRDSKLYSSESRNLQNSFRSTKFEIQELNDTTSADDQKVFELCVNEYSAQIEQLNILLRKALHDLEFRVEEVSGLEKSLARANELLVMEKDARLSERVVFDTCKKNLEFEILNCNSKAEARDMELKLLRDNFEDLQSKFANFQYTTIQEEHKKLNERHSQNIDQIRSKFETEKKFFIETIEMLEENLKSIHKKSNILEETLLRNDATISSLNSKILESESTSTNSVILLKDRDQIAEVCKAQSNTITSLQNALLSIATSNLDNNKVDDSTASFLMKSIFESLSLHIPDSDLIDQLYKLFLHISSKNQDLQASLQLQLEKSDKLLFYLNLEKVLKRIALLFPEILSAKVLINNEGEEYDLDDESIHAVLKDSSFSKLIEGSKNNKSTNLFEEISALRCKGLNVENSALKRQLETSTHLIADVTHKYETFLNAAEAQNDQFESVTNEYESLKTKYDTLQDSLKSSTLQFEDLALKYSVKCKLVDSLFHKISSISKELGLLRTEYNLFRLSSSQNIYSTINKELGFLKDHLMELVTLLAISHKRFLSTNQLLLTTKSDLDSIKNEFKSRDDEYTKNIELNTEEVRNKTMQISKLYSKISELEGILIANGTSKASSNLPLKSVSPVPYITPSTNYHSHPNPPTSLFSKLSNKISHELHSHTNFSTMIDCSFCRGLKGSQTQKENLRLLSNNANFGIIKDSEFLYSELETLKLSLNSQSKESDVNNVLSSIDDSLRSLKT